MKKLFALAILGALTMAVGPAFAADAPKAAAPAAARRRRAAAAAAAAPAANRSRRRHENLQNDKMKA